MYNSLIYLTFYFTQNITLHGRFYTAALNVMKATKISSNWRRRLAKANRHVSCMPLESSLAMTSVLELRMRRWLSGWSTHVLEAPTVPRPMHQNVRALSPPLDLLLRIVRVEIGNNWMSEGAVAGLTWIAEAAVSTYAR